MTYFVRFGAETLAAFLRRDEQQKRGFGFIQLDRYTVCYDIIQRKNDDLIHWGIGIDTIVDSEDLDEAIEIARSQADRIYSVISFCENTEVSLQKEKVAFEYNEEPEENNFVQFFRDSDDEITVGRQRKIDVGLFSEVVDALESVDSDSDNRKLRRALSSYMSALRQQTATDMFVWLYVAFDALENLFVSHYEIENTHSFYCDNCGDKTGETGLSNAGKKEFLESHSMTDIEYRELANIRGALIHSGKIGDAPTILMS